MRGGLGVALRYGQQAHGGYLRAFTPSTSDAYTHGPGRYLLGRGGMAKRYGELLITRAEPPFWRRIWLITARVKRYRSGGSV